MISTLPVDYALHAHRNTLLEERTQREIQEAMLEQERRLHRQLEAAQRRQAGAEAAAKAAKIAAAAATKSTITIATGAVKSATSKASTVKCTPATRTAKSSADVRDGRERADAVRRRRAMLAAKEARARVDALEQRGEARARSLLRSCVGEAGGGRGGEGPTKDGVIKLAADAFEAAALGGRFSGGKGGRRVVMGGGRGCPRSNVESWSEQARFCRRFESMWTLKRVD